MMRGKMLALDVALLASLCVAVVVAVSCQDHAAFNETHVEVRSADCVSCHRSEYEGATRPPHQGVFPETCASCHTNDTWSPAFFQHRWPLTGAHQTLPCAACHAGSPPVYVGTPQQCAGCHMSDYQTANTTVAGHGANPTTCETCHTTTAWKPASGGHPEAKFPILNGAHRVVECNQCHNANLGLNGRDNADCVGCHTGDHTRAKMDPKHNGVSRYPTGTAAPNFCLDCHANGRK